MLASLHVGLVVALWIATMWRVRAAREAAWRRSLWIVLGTLAASMTFRLPAVTDALADLTDRPGTATVLSHLAGLGTATALLDWTNALGTPTATAARWRRRHTWACVTAIALTGIYFTVPAKTPDQFLGTTASTLPAAAYDTALSLFLAVTVALASRSLWLLAQRAARRLLRAGLFMLAIGAALGALDVAGRLVFLLTRAGSGAAGSNYPLTSQFLDGLALAGMALMAIGCSLPACDALIRRIAHVHSLWKINELWRELNAQKRSVVALEPIERGTLTRFGWGDPMLLMRRTIEIRDCMVHLRRYVDQHDWDAVRSRLMALGLSGPQLDAAVEASWLRLAVDRRSKRVAPQRPATFTAFGGTSLVVEIACLKSVAAACRSRLVKQAVAAHIELHVASSRA